MLQWSNVLKNKYYEWLDFQSICVMPITRRSSYLILKGQKNLKRTEWKWIYNCNNNYNFDTKSSLIQSYPNCTSRKFESNFLNQINQNISNGSSKQIWVFIYNSKKHRKPIPPLEVLRINLSKQSKFKSLYRPKKKKKLADLETNWITKKFLPSKSNLNVFCA